LWTVANRSSKRLRKSTKLRSISRGSKKKKNTCRESKQKTRWSKIRSKLRNLSWRKIVWPMLTNSVTYANWKSKTRKKTRSSELRKPNSSSKWTSLVRKCPISRKYTRWIKNEK
jgi:hypothetical protein